MTNTDVWFWGFCTVSEGVFPEDVSETAMGPIFTGHK